MSRLTAGETVQGNKWLWYTMLLAAVGVAAFYIVKKTSGDEGSGAAAAAAAAASVASGSNLQGSGKAATTSFAGDSGSREVSYVIAGAGVYNFAVWDRNKNGKETKRSVSGRAIVASVHDFVCASIYSR
jgi:hypothetical protein